MGIGLQRFLEKGFIRKKKNGAGEKRSTSCRRNGKETMGTSKEQKIGQRGNEQQKIYLSCGEGAKPLEGENSQRSHTFMGLSLRKGLGETMQQGFIKGGT